MKQSRVHEGLGVGKNGELLLDDSLWDDEIFLEVYSSDDCRIL